MKSPESSSLRYLIAYPFHVDMRYAIPDFSGLGVVEAIDRADEIAGDPADAFKPDAFAYKLAVHCGPPVVPPLSPGCVWLLRLMFEAVTSPVALSDPSSMAVVAPPDCDCMESSPLMMI